MAVEDAIRMFGCALDKPTARSFVREFQSGVPDEPRDPRFVLQRSDSGIDHNRDVVKHEESILGKAAVRDFGTIPNYMIDRGSLKDRTVGVPAAEGVVVAREWDPLSEKV